jgi:hypothetical protein
MNGVRDERVRGIALDAITAASASARGDLATVAVLMGTYSDPRELRELAVACIGLAGRVIRHAAEASGISPDALAGAIVAELRERA